MSFRAGLRCGGQTSGAPTISLQLAPTAATTSEDLISTVDTLVAQARRILLPQGIDLESPFPREVEKGLRWGTATVPAPERPHGIAVAVGVPASARWTPAELVEAITDGLTDFAELDADEDIEIGSFQFELY